MKILHTPKDQDSILKLCIYDSDYDVGINKPTIKSINIFLDGQSNPEIEFMPLEGTCSLWIGVGNERRKKVETLDEE